MCSKLSNSMLFLLPEHWYPSPLYPILQAQVKLPTVFVQSALSAQLCVSVLHSSISLHPPAPVPTPL